MPSGCEFSGFDLINFSLKLLCNSLLWIVTGISIYLIYTNVKFQKRVTNIILTNILISDSLSALLSALYREYLSNCKIKPYTECTVVIFFSRTFGYISMAFLIFFTVERYFKLTKPAYEYSVRDCRNMDRIYNILSRYDAILNTFNHPELQEFVGTCMCFLPFYGAFDLFHYAIYQPESEIKLEATREQAEINKKIIKSVELDVFFMSLVLTALNLTTLGFTVTDLIKYSSSYLGMLSNIKHLLPAQPPTLAMERF
ncbi:hypothetical protein RF11_02353 [Thelohanellus kitauei]|uniref:G-protein coupled receptors family 1 profile domain-containing protein n=1 Tax=Thelohanellus kitauei TaxID=669202 RepID=A0A0C2NAG2_THEKT|nr:hypothetical protein RF11_02353 [Thelohanellus kitauei]